MTGLFEERVKFGMREVSEDPDAVRLALSGELDLAVADMLGDRLWMLGNAGYAVRLDLSALEFVDCRGLRELIIAVSESRSSGWRIEVDPRMTGPVRRTVELAGVRSQLWLGWRLAAARSWLSERLWSRHLFGPCAPQTCARTRRSAV